MKPDNTEEYAKNIICRTNCRTNCRSLALATNLYADDNEQKFFAYISGLFLNQLSPYIDNVDKVRYCTSTVIHKDNPTAGHWGNSREAWRWRSTGDLDDQIAHGFHS